MIAELIESARLGDEKAKARLVEENSGLIWSVAKRYMGRGVDKDDLYQLGCLGFLKAVDGFDTEFGTQFSTYAVPKIAGEIRRFLRDDGSVKVSRTIKERAATVKSTQRVLTVKLGREPTVGEVSAETGISAEDIALALEATAAVESIQQENGEDGYTLENILTDTRSEDDILERFSLRQAVALLPEREKRVIGLRYFHGLTQQQTAKIMSVSQVQVSRMEKRAIEHLRRALA